MLNICFYPEGALLHIAGVALLTLLFFLRQTFYLTDFKLFRERTYFLTPGYFYHSLPLNILSPQCYFIVRYAQHYTVLHLRP